MTETRAHLVDGTVLEFALRVPTVELALVIKALSYGSRMQARDVEDIYRLLEIANAYSRDEIGGWQLLDTPLQATRRDAARHLHEIGRRTRRASNDNVPAARLATLIAALVGRPG